MSYYTVLFLLALGIMPKPAPYISLHVATPDGALFQVRNPLKHAIKFRFECRDAFSDAYLEMPGHATQVVNVSAAHPIEGPCTLVWRSF